jgi:hypothetical protein
MKACAPILALRQALETAKRKERLDDDIRKAEVSSAEAMPITSQTRKPRGLTQSLAG